MILIIGIGIWIVLGILAFGLELAYWQGEYPTLAKKHFHEDRRMAFLAAVLGPVGFGVALRSKYGFMYFRPTEPNTSMDYFLMKNKMPWEEFLRCTICLRPQ